MFRRFRPLPIRAGSGAFHLYDRPAGRRGLRVPRARSSGNRSELYSISRLGKIDGFTLGHRLLGGLDGLELARQVEVDLFLDDLLDHDRHPVDAAHVDQGACALVQGDHPLLDQRGELEAPPTLLTISSSFSSSIMVVPRSTPVSSQDRGEIVDGPFQVVVDHMDIIRRRELELATRAGEPALDRRLIIGSPCTEAGLQGRRDRGA